MHRRSMYVARNGALLGAAVVASAFLVRDLAPAHPAFQTWFALAAWFLAPPIQLLNEPRHALPALFETRLARYALCALANAALYAAAAVWLHRTRHRWPIVQFGPLIAIPIASFAFVVARAMKEF